MIFLENFDVLKYFLIIFLHDKINFTLKELDHRKRVSQLLLFYWSLFFFICWKSLIQAIWYKHSFHFFLVVCKIAISWKNRHYKICFFTWLELSQPSFTLNFICLSTHGGHFFTIKWDLYNMFIDTHFIDAYLPSLEKASRRHCKLPIRILSQDLHEVWWRLLQSNHKFI